MSDSGGDSIVVYIGTYTQQLPHVNGTAEGIYVYSMDRASGAIRHLSTATGVVNPSFLVVEPRRRYLYAVQEVGELDGQQGGGVAAFAIDPHTRALELINQQPTHGAHPCYVALDQTGRWLLVANYSGGNVTVLPIAEDGSIGPAATVVQHHGPAGKDPHPHSIVAGPGNRFVLVPDAGIDQIASYRLDVEQGTLAAAEASPTRLPDGTGPRHSAFHPHKRYLYCINEQGSSVTGFTYTDSGELNQIQTVLTLPAEFAGRNSCADIHLDPAGRFLYGSNRGHDSIATFAVDDQTGELEPLGHTKTAGRTPRNFGVEPGGRFLLAANQDSNTIVTFAIDQATGALNETGLVATVPAPVCLCFVDFSH